MTDMGQLIEPVIPGLRRYANALVRDPAEADDLVQDCLERAVTRWGQRRGDGDTRSWLYAILHNLAVNRWRSLRRRGVMAAIETVDPAFLSVAPAQEHGLARADVLRALDQLPDEYRAVILLVTVEGLSYAETARILGVPLGTVMSRLSRGRARLASAMAEDTPVRCHLRRIK
ncbi:RNA polymerase sigma factor [Brevundimonas sp. EAKA]|jgi:RNA polymerase sigma-70 factor (ECF subfamily)|uniref:ECF RNA polymerase sigma factor SigR n=2 Tax=Brevundimonas mediterranea TaxID=74329 RepID=A0A7Z8Y5P1_9CAUL|nr:MULTISPECIES: sigma-70 family RNA polymerase sigma factor [unclassified Brevundimonas]KDP95890.1 RNA polymerase sigma factor [Brevundimonas sp. EAKA]MCG2663465.1 sigma-70 family RNA polymerase sigma factor [Brevundimonas sp.]OGN43479.1 MAG: RNA polymerase subunit sigma [Caulobacterales bacterium RIFCSPHIGHO2_01_FULL_67_30]VDC50858.1 ECF RNA polymerase sigma factor SigR [Brevundimonas mediterranea]